MEGGDEPHSLKGKPFKRKKQTNFYLKNGEKRNLIQSIATLLILRAHPLTERTNL